jgi:hypothetical protein
MRLTPPTNVTFLVAVMLILVGLVVQIGVAEVGDTAASTAFLLVAAGGAMLAAGVVLRRL